GARDATRPLFWVNLLSTFLGCHHIRDRYSATGFEDTVNLTKCRLLVRNQVQDAVAYDQIHRIAFNGHVLDLAQAKLNVLVRIFLSGFTCSENHLGRRIKANNSPFRPDKFRSTKHVNASAAAQIEYGLAFTNLYMG